MGGVAAGVELAAAAEYGSAEAAQQRIGLTAPRSGPILRPSLQTTAAGIGVPDRRRTHPPRILRLFCARAHGLLLGGPCGEPKGSPALRLVRQPARVPPAPIGVVLVPVVRPGDARDHVPEHRLCHVARTSHCSQQRPGRSPQIMRRPMRHRQPRALELGPRRAVWLMVVDGHLNRLLLRVRDLAVTPLRREQPPIPESLLAAQHDIQRPSEQRHAWICSIRKQNTSHRKAFVAIQPMGALAV